MWPNKKLQHRHHRGGGRRRRISLVVVQRRDTTTTTHGNAMRCLIGQIKIPIRPNLILIELFPFIKKKKCLDYPWWYCVIFPTKTITKTSKTRHKKELQFPLMLISFIYISFILLIMQQQSQAKSLDFPFI